MKHSTPSPSKADIARFEAFKTIGCIACRKHNVLNYHTECHHLLSGNKRRGHQFTIPLCPWHHRAFTHLSREQARETWGPSLAEGSKPFHERYGSDEELLKMTNELIEGKT